jgi:hypothetical protein
MEASPSGLRRQAPLCPLAQAKGKIERPYQWLQDRLVRTCVRDNTVDIRRARTFLRQEVDRYSP